MFNKKKERKKEKKKVTKFHFSLTFSSMMINHKEFEEWRENVIGKMRREESDKIERETFYELKIAKRD